MIQIEFARNASSVLETDNDVIGLAVGGSWITGQIDEFSDLDLIVVTRERISNNKSAMIAYAKRLGHFWNCNNIMDIQLSCNHLFV